MKFVFTDKKVNLPNKVHAYAEKKVGKLDRYFKADAEAAIVFSVEKDRNNVELTVRSGSTIIRVSERQQLRWGRLHRLRRWPRSHRWPLSRQ